MRYWIAQAESIWRRRVESAPTWILKEKNLEEVTFYV